MCLHIFICYLLLRFGCAQLTGEFWWLNDKFATHSSLQKPYSNTNDLNNEEYEVILFKDNDLDASQTINSNKFYKNGKNGYFSVRWYNGGKKSYGGSTIGHVGKMRATSKYGYDLSNRDDKFIIKYPQNHKEIVLNNNTSTNSLISRDLMIDTYENEIMTEKMSLNNIFLLMVFPYTSHREKSSENMLSIVKKMDWKTNDDFQTTTASYGNKEYNNLVCCIIPLQNDRDISVPETPVPGEFDNTKRHKRSNKEVQKQRNVLLKRRYTHHTPTDSSETKAQITTPDYDYDDPYWNIRNAKRPKKQRPDSRTIYNMEEYIEDYDVELPRPGLTGIYSDNGKPLLGWAFSNTNDGSIYDDVEDDDDNLSNFGYSTIDPRIDSPRISKSPIKPMRVTTASKESSFDAESQTISYHSNPDFNVLQDFKLLHLIRDKNKVIIKSKPTTAELISDSDSNESILNDPLEDISSDNEDFQIAKNCGKIAMPNALRFQGKQSGNTENGSHPWLAVLVPRRNMKKILCYASLIHKRAAITAADCALRTSHGDLTLIAGLWNYNERSHIKSRSISTILHPQFKSGELNNNLALIHWQRPLKLEVNVHPVCINKPHVGDDCIFAGWGGFDQAIRNRSRWQRATVHTCKDRLSLNGVNIPNEAFCASVRSPTTVTGLGGSLVCNVNGHVSAVGVAVSRDSTLVLLPIYDWVMQAIEVLNE